MELRREPSKLSIKRRESTDLFSDEPAPHPTSTPVRTVNRSEDEESPYFPCSTQEMRDDVDVLWDYNSPQSRTKTSTLRKSKKRLNLQQSPKVPFRRHPSNNNEQIKQDFNKLREELQMLRAEIARPDHEESLVLSPREEEAFKITQDVVEEQHIPSFDHIEDRHMFESDFEDPFDDGMNDQLIMFSQQVEGERFKAGIGGDTRKSTLNTKILPEITVNNCDTRVSKQQIGIKISAKNDTSNFYGQKSNFSTNPIKKKDQIASVQDNEVFNDSFDNMLSQMGEDDFNQLTQVVDIKMYKNDHSSCSTNKQFKVFPRSLSEDKPQFSGSISGKVEWHRTSSFENYNNLQLSEDKIREIERKRLQAKAKLEAKKKQEPVIAIAPQCTDSPLKCSPEEIEKKRLQALAKLEAKRKEIIEKKKQEALKRRQGNRRVNTAQVKTLAMGFQF